MARILPLEAASIAVENSIPFAKAATKATSDENGKIVAAKKAERKRLSSNTL